jgi:hydroxymethylbilane synthase
VALGGGCQLPLGAIAEERDHELTLLAVVASIDGTRILRHSARGALSEPESLGRHVADALAADGARALLGEVELR